MTKTFCDKCGAEIKNKSSAVLVNTYRPVVIRNTRSGINNVEFSYEVCSDCANEIIKLFDNEKEREW